MLGARPDGRQSFQRTRAPVGEDQCVCGEQRLAVAMIPPSRLVHLLRCGCGNVTVPLLRPLTGFPILSCPALPFQLQAAAWGVVAVGALGAPFLALYVHIAWRAHYSSGELRLYSPPALPSSTLRHGLPLSAHPVATPIIFHHSFRIFLFSRAPRWHLVNFLVAGY